MGERRADILIPPDLSRQVAEKVGDEAVVAKEQRKANENKRLSKSKPDKGQGKGDFASTQA